MQIPIDVSKIPLEVMECTQDVAGACAENELGSVYSQLVELAAGGRQSLEFATPDAAAEAFNELLAQARFWTRQAEKDRRADYGEFALFCGMLASQIHVALSQTRSSN